jgi:cell division protein FtsL
MKKANILIIFLLGLIISLSIGKAVLQNTLSTSGIYVGRIEQEINSYKTENTILSEELLTASSLTNIMEKAQQSGFTTDNTLMTLNASRPLAVRP